MYQFARVAIKFELNDIPTDANVTNAELALRVVTGSVSDDLNKVSLFAHDWNVNEATWDFAAKEVAWAEKGGDLIPDLSATTKAQASLSWEKFDVTAMVKTWMSGKNKNYGFLIETWHENVVGLAYISSNATSATSHPKLTITYDGVAVLEKVAKSSLLTNVVFNGKNVMIKPVSSKAYSVKIVTPAGKVVYNEVVGSGNQKAIDVASLSRGLYFANVSDGSLNQSVPFIVK